MSVTEADGDSMPEPQQHTWLCCVICLGVFSTSSAPSEASRSHTPYALQQSLAELFQGNRVSAHPKAPSSEVLLGTFAGCFVFQERAL